MKTKEEFAEEYISENYSTSGRAGDDIQKDDISGAIIEGIEFAQRWIPFTEDVPDLKLEVILGDETNRRSKVIMKMVSKDAIEYASETYTHWRPIEIS